MINSRKIMVIVNPVSGTGKKDGLSERIGTLMRAGGYDYTIIYTRSQGHATELAQKAVENKFYAVVACGGDGTINETASVLRDTNIILGIVPFGSGNGLARHLGLPMDTEKALDIVFHGKIAEIDYATVNERPFFCTFGVGLDAAVSHAFARQDRRGFMTYLKSAFREYFKYKPDTYSISANGKILTDKALMVSCCNASQWGNNARIAPKASVTDGMIDIVVVHRGSLLDSLVMGVDLFTGTLDKNTLITTIQAPSAVIYRNTNGPAHLDGEPIKMAEILDIKCHPKGLKIRVPEKN